MSCSCECDVGELYVGNTIRVAIEGLANASTAAYINDATVTYTLTTISGSVVDSLENEAMAYVSASNGNYEGLIPNTTPLTLGTPYRITIDATKSGVGVGQWTIDRVAKRREAC